MYRLSGCTPTHTIALCLEKRWGLEAKCGACGHLARWGLEKVATLPAGATLGEIAARVKCSECGSTEGLFWTCNADWQPGMGHSA